MTQVRGGRAARELRRALKLELAQSLRAGALVRPTSELWGAWVPVRGSADGPRTQGDHSAGT